MPFEQVGPVALLIAGILGLWRAFIKGDIVPGSLYRDERTRAERAEIQADRNTEALAAWVATMPKRTDHARLAETDSDG